MTGSCKLVSMARAVSTTMSRIMAREHALLAVRMRLQMLGDNNTSSLTTPTSPHRYGAHTAHRDHPDRRIMITWIGHRDRSAATGLSSGGLSFLLST